MRKPSRKVTTLIFDLDGTLVEHIINFPLIKTFLIDLLEILGIPRDLFNPKENTLRLIENAEQYLVTQGSTLAQSKKIREKILEVIEVFEWDAARKTKILPQVEEVLDVLKQNFHLLVLTNVKTDIAKFTLNRFNLLSRFSEIFGRDSVPSMKPNNRGMQHLLSTLGIKPEEAAMIGDSVIDVLPANELGVLSIGIKTGISSGDEFTKVGPRYLLTSISELPEVLERENLKRQ